MSRDSDGAWRWLTQQAAKGEGNVTFGLTEEGDVGIWLHGDRYHNCLAAGDDALDAVTRARAILDRSGEGSDKP